ncbi:hypothetical protein KS461_10000 [Pseudomonas chlororaphis]|uniref:hypothetical protein n=1 Tax=Pseudomonas chlororaphis TaxID=587753 RepID=UPI00215B6379|nr:hypothetical protein [Pseudomonas chlororaphis]UVE47593.1 hypothetical protein KS461_10000 [Pseudomonas chlororaphis]
MKLNSARLAWHDCAYNESRGGLSSLEQRCLLGTAVQTTERGITADHQVHTTLAGWIQSAIAKLHPQLRVFGDFMYSPHITRELTEDIREAAEDVVYGMAVSRSPRMTRTKKARAEFVVKGVLYRYQYMHQGGQSANPDPLSKPETFRAWMFDRHGVRLESCAWGRDWEGFIDTCFDCCADLDQMALAPIAAVLYDMKKEAA